MCACAVWTPGDALQICRGITHAHAPPGGAPFATVSHSRNSVESPVSYVPILQLLCLLLSPRKGGRYRMEPGPFRLRRSPVAHLTILYIASRVYSNMTIFYCLFNKRQHLHFIQAWVTIVDGDVCVMDARLPVHFREYVTRFDKVIILFKYRTKPLPNRG